MINLVGHKPAEPRWLEYGTSLDAAIEPKLVRLSLFDENRAQSIADTKFTSSDLGQACQINTEQLGSAVCTGLIYEC
jgi:hypothetical protein